MKKMRQKGLALLLVLALFVCAVPASKAEAASKAYMKTLNVSWNLKNNKTVTIHTKFAGISSLKNMTVKMTNYKLTDAKKAGYKKVTFTLTYKYTFKPTKKQVHKMANSSFAKKTGHVCAGCWYTAVDYDTGKCLEADNDLGVTVTSSDWIYSQKNNRYEDNDNCYVAFGKSMKIKVTITFPEDYTGLCIGVGGYTKLNETSADTKFWSGNAKFGKTRCYSKTDKKVAHFMRVN